MPVLAIPTPLDEWNRSCQGIGGGEGLAVGWHVTIGGNTGSGKSLLALNLGASALRAGHNVCYVNLEMTRAEIRHRIYSIVSGIPVQELSPGNLFSYDAKHRLQERAAEVLPQGAHFYANKDRLRDIDEIQQFMERHLEYYGCDLFIVDYIQRVRSNARTLLEKVINTSITVSDFAKDNGVVTVGLSQLRKSSGADDERPPGLHDLRGSSQIEDDSNQVLLLDHSTYREYERGGTIDEPYHRQAETALIIAKNRSGPTGTIPVHWSFLDLTIREQ